MNNEQVVQSISGFATMPITREFKILRLPFYRFQKRQAIAKRLRPLYAYLAQSAIKQAFPYHYTNIIFHFNKRFEATVQNQPDERERVLRLWRQYDRASTDERPFTAYSQSVLEGFDIDVKTTEALADYLKFLHSNILDYYKSLQAVRR